MFDSRAPFMKRRQPSSGRRAWPFAVAVLALSVAACGGPVSEGMGSISESLGIGPKEEFQQMAANPTPRPQEFACPPVIIRDGTETYRVYDRDREGDAMAVQFQGTIGETARECFFDGATRLTMKFGVTGRVLLGPAGQPATFELPLRAAFVSNGEPVWSQLVPVQVTIPPGARSGEFVVVNSDLVYEFPPDTGSGSAILYVGFDEQADS